VSKQRHLDGLEEKVKKVGEKHLAIGLHETIALAPHLQSQNFCHPKWMALRLEKPARRQKPHPPASTMCSFCVTAGGLGLILSGSPPTVVLFLSSFSGLFEDRCFIPQLGCHMRGQGCVDHLATLLVSPSHHVITG
jgi:hypothetical protein